MMLSKIRNTKNQGFLVPHKADAFRGKRGISPLIATIVLIALAIAMFGVIFFWLRGLVTENVQKFGISIDTQCQKLVFTAKAEGNRIYINNQGNIPIAGFYVKAKIGSKTISKGPKKPLDGVVSAGESDFIDLAIEPNFNFATATGTKTVTPVLQGKAVKSGDVARHICSGKAVNI